jgi:hypothetical protein
MDFNEMVRDILREDIMAGGAESVFGPNVGATATPFSGDNYAPGDARRPTSIFGGVLTRSGLASKKRKRKKIKYKKRKK